MISATLMEDGLFMKNDKNESLLELAKNAKKRMKQGYWADIIEARKNGFTHSSSQFLRESDTAIKNGEAYFAQPRAGAILESGNIEYKIYNETSTFKA